jgi:NAD(P)-dependent dehydrogenase (short-subunit alcohol dehydrogenase family)
MDGFGRKAADAALHTRYRPLTEATFMEAPVHYSYPPAPVMPRVPAQHLLLGQKALVTGASSGIGRAIALSLADGGADVVVNYAAGAERAQGLAAEIEAKGRRGLAIRADVADESQVDATFRQAIASFGTLDIVVNNPGMQQDAPFHQMTLAQWDRVMAVNLTGSSSARAPGCVNSCTPACVPRSPAPRAKSCASARCMKSSRRPAT